MAVPGTRPCSGSGRQRSVTKRVLESPWRAVETDPQETDSP